MLEKGAHSQIMTRDLAFNFFFFFFFFLRVLSTEVFESAFGVKKFILKQAFGDG